MGVDVEVLNPGDGNYAGFVFLDSPNHVVLAPFGSSLSRFALASSLSCSRARVHARARARAAPRARRSENFSLLNS